MSDLISIIIPVYNHEQALHQALASIAAQTYKDIEIIIVDDGSSVPVKCQVSTFVPSSGRGSVKCSILHQQNRGAPAARNRGLEEAKGEYVIFWDADVIGEPEMLKKMHQTLQESPMASYTYSDFYFGRKKMPARLFDSEALRQNNYIHSTSLIRRAALSPKPWDESLKRFQDWDLWLTFLENNKTGVYVPEYLFRVIPRKRGMSYWLPSFAYRAPWRWLPWMRGRVREYEDGRAAVVKKHGLNGD